MSDRTLQLFRDAEATRRAYSERFDCATCGACCAPSIVLMVRLDRQEQKRLKMEEYQRLDAERPCPKWRGTVGTSSRCTVYADRPGECADFVPGSAKCRVLRARAGIDPPAPERIEDEAFGRAPCLRCGARALDPKNDNPSPQSDTTRAAGAGE